MRGECLGEVEKEGFGVFARSEGEKAGVFGADGIAGLEGGAIERDAAFDELEPGAATGGDFMRGGFASSDAYAVDVGILVDGGAVFATIGGDDEHFLSGLVLWLGVPLGVAGHEAASFGLNPDLQQ